MFLQLNLKARTIWNCFAHSKHVFYVEIEPKQMMIGTHTDAWTTLCGQSECPFDGEGICKLGLPAIMNPSSCINHVLVISIDALLLVTFLSNAFYNGSSRTVQRRLLFQDFTFAHVLSALACGGLGLVYLVLGIWTLEEKLRMEQSVVPLHKWLVMSVHGLTWLLVSLILSFFKKCQFSKTFARSWSTIVCLLAGYLCVISVLTLSRDGEAFSASAKFVLDVLSLPVGLLLVFHVFHGIRGAESARSVEDHTLCTPLDVDANGKAHGIDSGDYVTQFAYAGYLSRMTFSWLNPLLKRGGQRTLEEKDVPKLRKEDQAESCYLQFVEKLNRQKLTNSCSSPSIFWTIVSCNWKEILLSGFFALLKIITVSAGPLLLNAFIKVAEGQSTFRYEGYVLAGVLFVAKCLESLSQRQWYFRCRLIGLKVRSLLSAAVYQKQLKLSNTARAVHSAGEIMSYVTVDAYRVGEFPYWFHQTWTTSLQLCFALAILFHAVGLATIAALVVIILTVACNAPLAKLQHKFQTKLMEAQDKRLKAMTEALVHMKVLKLYAWETHLMTAIESLRKVELKWLSAFQLRKAYNTFLFWSSPVLISAATFGACYLLQVPLTPSNVFTFVATLRLVQDPVRSIPEVMGVVIQANVAFSRVVGFLEAPELQGGEIRTRRADLKHSVAIKSASFSWEGDLSKPTLKKINLEVRPGQKVAICGEVGSGKSTLLSAILGEIPKIEGSAAWIQTGTIRENIIFGSSMDDHRYQEVLEKCSLVKDLDMLPYGDLTEIGERGVNLSGGQKQRIQLARALYHDADVYLLDDPFSAVDAHTASSLFNEYVMGALSGKTVLLVTHQVDFLPTFDTIWLMSDGEILHAATFSKLLATSREFQDLVNAHKKTAVSESLRSDIRQKHETSFKEISILDAKQQKSVEMPVGDQLIKKEEKESGDTGLKPYLQYLNQNKGYLYFTLVGLSHLTFVAGQILQNTWMAANVSDPHVSRFRLISVYLAIGFASAFILLSRSLFIVILCIQTSKSLFSQLLNSLFRAPMTFFDSTPLGRILSRVSSDLSIVDLDVPFSLAFTLGSTLNAYSNLGVLTVVTWQLLFLCLPMIYLIIQLQKYYFTSAKELMRINGTTKSVVANHLAESLSGAMTIRAFKEEDRFFAKNLKLIDQNASPFFHNFAANEWLIQRLETMSAAVLCSSALAMALLPTGTFKSGFIGMALSYGLSLNMSFVFSVQNQCMLANYIISVERLNQYMHVPSEAPEVIEGKRPPPNWPVVGKLELQDLKIRYRHDTPLVLHGISCTFEGGHKIGIVGRTGSGKSTLVGALFRLVEPAGGKIIVDGLDISRIGLHDLRSHFGIIPQDPTLFHGSVRYNLDPLAQHTDQEIWEVLEKCQLRETVEEKKEGLDSLVIEDGSNWSMGQRQLFCLGRALLRRSQILVLDEATASIDNATDAILQKTIREEFSNCTVITVAHRIPTVMDCMMVLGLSDGKLIEYDEPAKLMKREGSLFRELVREYCLNTNS